MVRIISALILAVTAACATANEPPLVDNPPERHIVLPGDTLWGISGKFLKQPWRWPELWRMNQSDIKNPHRIYPGDIVWLDFSDGQPRLRLGKPIVTKLEPRVHATATATSIPSIPPNVIEPYISQPLILEEADSKQTTRIVATPENRVLLGNGDQAFVSGIADASIERWHVFRPGKPLTDPETGKVIAQEAFFLGHARLVQPGSPATVLIVSAKEEITRGDWLQPAPPTDIVDYIPHRPNQEIDARLMSIYGGVQAAGAGAVVALNRGEQDGLERGHVLALYRKRVSVDLDDEQRRVTTVIPDERYGLLFVFRVFERVAYALVMESSRTVVAGDAARTP